jgi:hypothetical protein
VYVELHKAFVSHSQQQGVAIFFIQDIGTFHNLINLERLLAERIQNILSIVQHEYPFYLSQARQSLRGRQLIFSNYSHDIISVAFDAVSKTTICLNGQWNWSELLRFGPPCEFPAAKAKT